MDLTIDDLRAFAKQQPEDVKSDGVVLSQGINFLLHRHKLVFYEGYQSLEVQNVCPEILSC